MRYFVIKIHTWNKSKAMWDSHYWDINKISCGRLVGEIRHKRVGQRTRNTKDVVKKISLFMAMDDIVINS